jgi:hypothetical protein
MSRFFFFTQEAFRALRRNGAPSMAAIVTTVTTVILLGVLIPVFQTTQAKSESVRDSLEFRVALYDDATQGEIAALEGKLKAIPHVASVTFISKGKALAELEKDLGKSKSEDLLAQLHDNPLPANFQIKADDASNLDAVRAAVTPPGPNGKPKAISPIIQDVFDRQQESQQIQRAEDRPDRDHRALDPRLADAGRQHDPALDLHPPPRGRGDAAGRRDPLVHPLALHDRGRRRRLRRWPDRHTYPVAGQDHDRRPAERHLLLPRGAEQQHPLLSRPGGDPLRRLGAGLRGWLRRHPAPLPEGVDVEATHLSAG